MHHAVNQLKQCRDGHDWDVHHAVERNTSSDWREGRERFKFSLGPARRYVCQAGPEVARESAAFESAVAVVAVGRVADEVDAIVDGAGEGHVGRGGAADGGGGRELEEQVRHYSGVLMACVCVLYVKKNLETISIRYIRLRFAIYSRAGMDAHAHADELNEVVSIWSIFMHWAYGQYAQTPIVEKTGVRVAGRRCTGQWCKGPENYVTMWVVLFLEENEAVKLRRVNKQFNTLYKSLRHEPYDPLADADDVWDFFKAFAVRRILAMPSPSTLFICLQRARQAGRAMVVAERQLMEAPDASTGEDDMLSEDGLQQWEGLQMKTAIRWTEFGELMVLEDDGNVDVDSALQQWLQRHYISALTDMQAVQMLPAEDE